MLLTSPGSGRWVFRGPWPIGSATLMALVVSVVPLVVLPSLILPGLQVWLKLVCSPFTSPLVLPPRLVGRELTVPSVPATVELVFVHAAPTVPSLLRPEVPRTPLTFPVILVAIRLVLNITRLVMRISLLDAPLVPYSAPIGPIPP